LNIYFLIRVVAGFSACVNKYVVYLPKMISIKPHHFIDIIAAFGEGASFAPHPYGHAVHTVARKILKDINTKIKIELGADDICAPCIHNINGLCDDTIDTSFRPLAPRLKREWNLLVDKRWCQCLGLKQGDALTGKEFCERAERCLKEIPNIYRENPPGINAQKLSSIKKGLARIAEEDK